MKKRRAIYSILSSHDAELAMVINSHFKQMFPKDKQMPVYSSVADLEYELKKKLAEADR